jgi:MHS family proline/betaine transporter-like MFS transporter
MVLLRMPQGVAVGGEYTSSIVFLVESAPQGKRAFYSSWVMFGAVAGTMLGSAVGAGMTNFLTDEALMTWGWRGAFLGGIAVAFVGYMMRWGMPAEEAPAPLESPLKIAFTKYWREMLRVAALNIVSAVSFYLIFVYIVTWLIERVQEPNSTALNINTLSMATLLLFISITAILSDKYGRRLILLLRMGSMAVMTYPLLWLMHHPDTTMILTGQIAFAAICALFMSGLPAAMTEMFPHNVRVSAVSVGYNLTYAIFRRHGPYRCPLAG